MFTKEDIKALATYRSETTPVLSVYLNVDITQLTVEQYRLTLKGLLKSASEQEARREDIEAVERYVELEYDGQGKGLAVFSGERFWQAYALDLPVGDLVHVGAQPYVKPLADYFDAYDRYGVVLVDREGARLFLFNQGTLQDATGLLGQELKEHDDGAAGRGGRSGRGSGQGRAASVEGHLDQVVMHNLRDTVNLTERFYKRGQCERIILGGTEENRAQFMSMLPKALQGKVIGDVSIDMYASASEVLDRTMGIIQSSVAERKAQLVQDLISASYNERGSLGLAKTMVAVQEQRVQTLVISEGFGAPGSVCSHCGYLTLRQTNQCPVCEGRARQVPDVVELLVRRALGMDVEVVFVEDEALQEAGSIGALWRF
jgi:peptide subunit release factor 1 (eRF1)